MEKDGIITIHIRNYKLKEIAAIYGMHRDTMRIWLKTIEDKLGKRQGHYYNIDQVRTIFRIYKLPSYVQVKDESRYFE